MAGGVRAAAPGSSAERRRSGERDSRMLLYSALTVLGTLGLALCGEPLARLLGVLDRPDGVRKLHVRPTPLTLGLAVVLPVAAFLAATAGPTGLGAFAPVAALAGGAFFLLGYADDRAHLSPTLRLFLAVCIALVAVSFAPGAIVSAFEFTFLKAPVSIAQWNILFSVLVLVGFVYAYNMADGMNGLALGLSLIWSLLLLSYAPAPLAPVFATLVCALAVAFFFNATGRQFLGDSGAYGLGILIALLTNGTYNALHGALPADAVALWFIVPVADCVRMIVLRVARGRSPLSPDREHLHHRLAQFVGERAAVCGYLLLVGAPAALAFFLPELTAVWFALCLLAYAGLLAATARRGLAQRAFR